MSRLLKHNMTSTWRLWIKTGAADAVCICWNIQKSKRKTKLSSQRFSFSYSSDFPSAFSLPSSRREVKSRTRTNRVCWNPLCLGPHESLEIKNKNNFDWIARIGGDIVIITSTPTYTTHWHIPSQTSSGGFLSSALSVCHQVSPSSKRATGLFRGNQT
jgi:hypothetical protein